MSVSLNTTVPAEWVYKGRNLAVTLLEITVGKAKTKLEFSEAAVAAQIAGAHLIATFAMNMELEGSMSADKSIEMFQQTIRQELEYLRQYEKDGKGVMIGPGPKDAPDEDAH